MGLFKDKERDKYMHGNNWAINQLAKGQNVLELESYIDNAKILDNYRTYEMGIEDAIRVYRQLENRIQGIDIQKALVGFEYREQARAFHYSEDCDMGKNARSRLYMIYQLAHAANIPMAYLV